MVLPDSIADLEQLDEVMTRPSDTLIAFMRRLRGPLMVIGASGKMGPSLCVLASRAAAEAGTDTRVIAVARFTDAEARHWLEQHGVQTLQCDVLDSEAVMALPDAANIVYMVGRKFGTTDNPGFTWALNALPPVYVCKRFAQARIVALSTGCVYPLRNPEAGGSVESDELTPVGEYANACVARERIFEYSASLYNTNVCQIRLNYALDLRYGVFVDIAQNILHGLPVDLGVGYVNCIWQRDANDCIIRALDLCQNPPCALNLTGNQVLSVRTLAGQFGAMMNKPVLFTGTESMSALLSNPEQAYQALGAPDTPLETVAGWTAHWLMNNNPTLNKPTHFQVKDGRY